MCITYPLLIHVNVTTAIIVNEFLIIFFEVFDLSLRLLPLCLHPYGMVVMKYGCSERTFSMLIIMI